MISNNSFENVISKAVDYAGIIPGVCLISGLLKVIYGVVKMIFNHFKALCQVAESELAKKFYNEASYAWNYIKDGSLEIFHIKFATIAVVAFADLLSYCGSSYLSDKLFECGVVE